MLRPNAAVSPAQLLLSDNCRQPYWQPYYKACKQIPEWVYIKDEFRLQGCLAHKASKNLQTLKEALVIASHR